ncbi:subtilase [Galactobacter valiniphilus]|uniref:Subtilase n=1 Tax=Galactobacter valiniphilus TaxID=2676122 RepID=A0A399J944_9MICC|nr:S8 family serine peptidase [Galactobacter valiniphilus]RII42075.1 subtilase [Galactobacter valiniphilus]
MSHPRLRFLSRAAAAALGAGALTLSFVTPSVAAPDTPDAPSSSQQMLERLKDLKVAGSLRGATGEVSVYVQFTGEGTFAATQSDAVKQGKQRPSKNVAKVKSLRQGIETKGSSAAAQADAKVLYKTSNALPGVALRGDAQAITDLAARPDVAKITAIVPKHPDNSGTDIDTGALASWQKLNQTGEGITIAVLDTGIDYTHAGFGGPGTLEAYKTAQASATLPTAASGLLDPKKFIGGWDLVGDDYDANPNNPTYQPVPHPDPNPLDCSTAGHGSHVAGTAAGYGTTADGKTFKGDYSTLTEKQVKAMRIGPGSAPEASLVGIRVFGCEGSSDVVGQALDYVLDPNRDGDFSDRAQIVNMSLGSDFSPTDDPENDIVDALSAQGILSVVASGNSSDVTDVGGSPGNSRSSLTVANSVGSLAAADPTDVTAPSELAGAYASQLSANFPWAGAVSGDVVVADGGSATTGCQPITGNVKGKWVFLHWTDDPTGQALPCGSKARFDNAEKAGATGVVLDAPSDYFTAGIAGNTTIPGVQLTKSSADKLHAAAEAGTLKVTVDPSKRGTVTSPTGVKDSLNASSSRGVHGTNGVSKPDVAAPGTSIGSVGVGSGNGAAVMSGTSMATPHTAGIAALVAASGNYTPQQIKALVMNTATTDVLKDGVAYGPHRVGSGRVEARKALENHVIAYDKDAADVTSVVFGVIEAKPGTSRFTRTVELKNLGTTPVTYNVSYLAATAMPGATISLDKKSVTVPSKGIARVKVTLTLKGSQLSKTLDPTSDAEQLGVARSYLADVTGRLQFTSSTEPTLRLPVTAAPKPVSKIEAKSVRLDVKKLSGTVKLGGRGLDQGSGSETYQGLVSTLTLGTTSTRQPAALDKVPGARAMDLQYVGANSTAPSVGAANGRLDIGISTWGNWTTLTKTSSGGPLEIDVLFDTDGDGKADFASYTTGSDDLDLTLVNTVDLKTGKRVDQQPLNGLFGDVDSNAFDTNVAVLPVLLSSIGVSQSNASKLRYQVSTWSSYNNVDGENVAVDETGWIGFNPFAPGAKVASPATTLADLPGQTLSVKLTDSKQKLLLLHHHNAAGDLSGKKKSEDGGKAEVVSFR